MDEKRERIVVVDDVPTNLTIARTALADKYDVFTAPSGDKLFSLMKRLTPDLILLDIEMPEMDGYEVIAILKASKETAHIPVIFLTGKIDPEHEITGLNLGAVDYVTKPFSRELLLKRIDMHILFEKQKQELSNYNQRLEYEIERKTKTVMELQTVILKAVVELVECRDSITGGHIDRTQLYLSRLIDMLCERGIYSDELSALDVPLLIMSSQLHDVGKIAIRDNILLKLGPLNHEELEEMKRHTTYGVDIIKKIENNATENEFLSYAQMFAGTHHERWDGLGYPLGLKGEDIPIPGRLMALVDAYDALTNDRPYKDAFTHEEAVGIIKDGNRTWFDPILCDIFIENHLVFKQN
ncbi:MAG: response regulator [Oscillospiraceae bacterium]|jgi:putative two-component system response regulator|nr:response regulator [Oscillospiraceae bacterium]